MKRKFDHPAPAAGEELSGPRYWRSLDELAATPGFQAQLEREFPEGASDLNGVDRRNFMKLMAASFALGGVGLSGCRRPEKFILPYGKSVEGVIPGLPSYYATSMPVRKSAVPLLAETFLRTQRRCSFTHGPGIYSRPLRSRSGQVPHQGGCGSEGGGRSRPPFGDRPDLRVLAGCRIGYPRRRVFLSHACASGS